MGRLHDSVTKARAAAGAVAGLLPKGTISLQKDAPRRGERWGWRLSERFLVPNDVPRRPERQGYGQVQGFGGRATRRGGGSGGAMDDTHEFIREPRAAAGRSGRVNPHGESHRAMAEFLAGVSPDIPWHITAFHPDYKMGALDATSAETLIRGAEIGYRAGLRYVYAGNWPGRVGPYENTFCPSCKATLIERYGFRVLQNRIKGGRCPRCHTEIAGRWEPVVPS